MTSTFTSGNDDRHDLASLYAIDALDPDEADHFARHLPGCPPCQQEVAEMRTASTALALAAVTPLPPGLRQRVLAEVARQPQIPARPVAPAPPVAPLDPADTGAVGPSAEGGPGGFDPAATVGREVIGLDAARRRSRRRPRLGPTRLVAVAAAAVVVLAGAVATLTATGNGGPDDGRAGAEAAFAAVQAAPDARTLALVGGDPGSRVQVAWSAGQNRVVLLADGVPDPGSGRAYELWRIDAAGPAPAGLFDPDSSGEAGLVAPLHGGDPAAWGVTVEPDGGSAAPTLPIVYQAEA